MLILYFSAEFPLVVFSCWSTFTLTVWRIGTSAVPILFSKIISLNVPREAMHSMEMTYRIMLSEHREDDRKVQV